MGEFDLIAKMRERLTAEAPRVRLGMGDDAAVTVPGGATATSVDALVEGVHFRREELPLGGIGRKALAAGLSDLAAMGAEAGEAYVVLAVPPDLDESGCLEIFDGIAAMAAETGTALAGGDITRATELAIAVTVVGHARDAGDFVSRGGAGEGEALVLTGELGGSAAGLLLLSDPGLGDGLDPGAADALRSRQLDPRPRLAAGRALARAGATAMIDVSDGLGADAGHLAAESGVRLEIDLGATPLQAGVAEVAEAAGRDPFELAASGGEDYELLACLADEDVAAAREAVAACDGTLSVIGRSAAGERVRLSAPGNREVPPRGYDQLS